MRSFYFVRAIASSRTNTRQTCKEEEEIKIHKEVKMNAIESGLDKTKCKFSANFAFDAATYERTNRCKTTDTSRTYLDVRRRRRKYFANTNRQ